LTRPELRLVLAVSLDGRLAPAEGGAAQLGGRGDRQVLEGALAWADGVLVGAGTLRMHGSTCLIHRPELLAQRRVAGRSPQPLAIVVSRSGVLPPDLPFFEQPLQRGLLRLDPSGGSVTETPLDRGLPLRPVRPREWDLPLPSSERSVLAPGFKRHWLCGNWSEALAALQAAGMARLAVLGGAALAASLLAENLLDELQLTLCPRLLGGPHSWLPATAGVDLASQSGWRLLEQRALEGEELLLRYGRGLGLAEQAACRPFGSIPPTLGS
jgi:5-amino-6-(5-phosphoribosylamino)uracil reductase